MIARADGFFLILDRGQLETPDPAPPLGKVGLFDRTFPYPVSVTAQGFSALFPTFKLKIRK